jgi:four helix bundle protein
MNGLMDESMNQDAVTKLVAKAWDLSVYQTAFALALELHEISLSFPKNEQYALADQMRRSSKSICANIGEGFAKQKYSKAEFSRFLSIAEASANETQVWLQFAFKLNYITEKQFLTWANLYEKIAAQIYKLRP